MSLNLRNTSDINVSGFNRTQNVRLEFYQSNPAYKYYRLKLTADGVANMYIFLGAYTTNPQYAFTHTFAFNDSTQVFNGALKRSSFEAYFRQYFGSNNFARFSVYLQSSTLESFSSNVVSSTESRFLSIRLSENDNFIPAWSKPTYKDLKYSENQAVQALTGSNKKGVQGVSNFEFTLEKASAMYGATIERYTLSIAGAYTLSYTDANVTDKKYLNLSLYTKLTGNVDVTYTVEDSRGFKRSYTQTITVLPYSKAELTENNTHRQGGTGGTVLLDFQGRWYGEPLALTCQEITAYEQGSDVPFATLSPAVTVSGNTFSYKGEWANVTFDRSKAYTIKAVFTDGITTSELAMTVPVGTPVIAVRDRKVGINNSDPQSSLDVLGTIIQNGFPVLGYKGKIGTAESCNLNNYTEGGYYFYAGNSAEIAAFPSGYTKTTKFVLLVIDMGDYKIQKTFNIAGTITEHKRAYNNGFLSWN